MILNGRWIAGASGKKVFSGMLAAPKKYAFGTKIYLKGLWIGAVEDRGWAIVPAGQRWYSHDRIDVWVWYGDEGLRRAMYWGKRKVKWNIVSHWKKSTIDYKNIPAPRWATKWLKKNIKQKESIFNMSLGKWSESSKISELQDTLLKLGYLGKQYKKWVYDSETITAVYKFQRENSVVKSESSAGAWSYGPKTRAALKKVYLSYQAEEKKKNAFITKYRKLEESLRKDIQADVDAFSKISRWEVSHEVRAFQKTLNKLWFFPHKDTAIFWEKTTAALINYQVAKNIISSKQTVGAGILWPKTQKQIINDLVQIDMKNILTEKQMLKDYEKYIVKKDTSNT